jgi:hypothetical protein
MFKCVNLLRVEIEERPYNRQLSVYQMQAYDCVKSDATTTIETTKERNGGGRNNGDAVRAKKAQKKSLDEEEEEVEMLLTMGNHR